MHAGKSQPQSLAIAYSVKRKANKHKMAEGGDVEDDRYFEQQERDAAKAHRDDLPMRRDPMSHEEREEHMRGLDRVSRVLEKMYGKKFAEGGGIIDTSRNPESLSERGIHHTTSTEGRSPVGNSLRNKYRDHADAIQEAKEGHKQILSELRHMPIVPEYSEGGVVDRVMKKRYSEGGRVANTDELTADFDPMEFDYLHLRDDLEFSETGDNSGDFLGDEQEDEDRRDIVSRVMRSRAKQDRMPNPA